ncbi:MAG: TIGR01777 family oxidoreductase [Desulfobulbus sp.]|nr:TIGR01777 family oxidoreductase [Desulfobulbus sp.]
MNSARFVATTTFPGTARALYDWHTRPGALERLTPPWERMKVLERTGTIEPGAEVVLGLHAGPLPYRWHAHHVAAEPGVFFKDVQLRGPFARWTHTHRFTDTANGARLDDEIDYALPGHRFLPRSAKKRVEAELARMFAYRHATLQEDLQLHGRCSTRPLSILISGASGVLGSALKPLLTTGGHQVWTLVRRKADRSQGEIYWNPERGELNLAGLPHFDGVIHLAGDNIGEGRWTDSKKKRVIDSRVLGTGLIARTLADQPVRPAVLLSASAVGFYGNCLDCCMLEEDAAGQDFISDVCTLWERSATPAADAGIRTVFMRIGVVLSPQGGALQRLLATRAVGFPNRFGSGDQYISWISINDMVGAILHVLTCPDLVGPVNIAAPHPVTNGELLQTLAKVLRRPLLPAVPASLLRTVYGQMASEVLLGGCRVSTDKLQQSGYIFRHPRVAGALRALLGKKKITSTQEENLP